MMNEDSTETIKMDKLAPYKPKVIYEECSESKVYVQDYIEPPPIYQERQKTIWNLFGLL